MMLQMNLTRDNLERFMAWVNSDYVVRVNYMKNVFAPESRRPPLYVVLAKLVSGDHGEFSTETEAEAYRMLRMLGCPHPDDPDDEEPF